MEAVQELALQRFVGFLVELARRIANDYVEGERAQRVEDEGPVVRAARGERLSDGFAERDAGVDRRRDTVGVAERLQAGADLGEHRLLVLPPERELAGSLVQLEQVLDLGEGDQLERALLAL